MIERTDRIRLPAGQWYCSSDVCRRAPSCARRIATVPPRGVMADGRHEAPLLLGGCLQYMSEAEARRLVQLERSAAAARRVLPPIG